MYNALHVKIMVKGFACQRSGRAVRFQYAE